jgi:hypothetical protein
MSLPRIATTLDGTAMLNLKVADPAIFVVVEKTPYSITSVMSMEGRVLRKHTV